MHLICMEVSQWLEWTTQESGITCPLVAARFPDHFFKGKCQMKCA